MLKLSKIVKNYRETGALSENVSVYGFLDEHVFLTKAGDLGVVLNVEGVDYECLDQESHSRGVKHKRCHQGSDRVTLK
jgi:type IV secretion system protein VirB4